MKIDPAVFIARCRAVQRRGALATVIASGRDDVPVGARVAVHPGGYVESSLGHAGLMVRIANDARGVVTTGRSTSRSYAGYGGAIEVQIDAVVPPPRLIVFGAGELAERVHAAAELRGWDVIDARHGAPSSDHLSLIDASDRAAAIVIAHGDALDREVVEALLATRVRYVGIAGPRARVAPLVASLGEGRIGGPDGRVHVPVHADLATEPARAVAEALIAEANAVLSGETPVRPTLRRAALGGVPSVVTTRPLSLP